MLGIWTCMYQVFGYLLSRISFRWIVLNRGTFSGIFSFLKGGARKVIITKDFVRSWTNCCSVVIRKYGSCEVILSLLDKRNEVPIFLIYPVNLRSLGVQIREVLLTLFRLEYIVPQWRNLYLRYCETTSEKLFLKLLSKPGQSKINTWIDRNSFPKIHHGLQFRHHGRKAPFHARPRCPVGFKSLGGFKVVRLNRGRQRWYRVYRDEWNRRNANASNAFQETPGTMCLGAEKYKGLETPSPGQEEDNRWQLC